MGILSEPDPKPEVVPLGPKPSPKSEIRPEIGVITSYSIHYTKLYDFCLKNYFFFTKNVIFDEK